MAYLDEAGLSYFWGKVKARLAAVRIQLSALDAAVRGTAETPGLEGRVAALEEVPAAPTYTAGANIVIGEDGSGNKRISTTRQLSLCGEAGEPAGTIGANGSGGLRLDCGSLELGSGGEIPVTGVGDPAGETSAVNRRYVDRLMGDLSGILDAINGEVV